MENKISDLLTTVNPPECSTSDQNSTQLDDDMVMVQEVATKCPYTGKEMRDPVKNIHCKHNYDREGITAAMKLRKGKTRCPVPGCVNDKPISTSDLEENHELRLYIDKKNRQHDKKNRKM
ncbi:hypothetical protein LSH36_174g01009 [Paralvinella palmiformis]|uniref:E3 SUMO-protein ligase NSE2 n=1 Tax=Paralvinella palmiformis TaxID=53620 RepID=A0AAD9JS57_9ANNE|nr:hypothetical protein LSH36_174g01009 [Paralvinella palmiformis]